MRIKHFLYFIAKYDVIRPNYFQISMQNDVENSSLECMVHGAGRIHLSSRSNIRFAYRNVFEQFMVILFTILNLGIECTLLY